MRAKDVDPSSIDETTPLLADSEEEDEVEQDEEEEVHCPNCGSADVETIYIGDDEVDGMPSQCSIN